MCSSDLKAIVKSLGINVCSEANDNILAYCPLHSNRHTPSFSISCKSGAWLCFNPSCGEAGSLIELVKKILHKNDFEAIRFISSKEIEASEDFDETLKLILEDKPDFEEFSQQVLDKLYDELGKSNLSRDYFKSRGITEESMHYFKLGFSAQQNMVIVPVHSPDGIPVGLVGDRKSTRLNSSH